MSLASGESKSSGGKKFWWPLSWGVRFTIAVMVSALAWWYQLYWINGRALTVAQAELFSVPFLVVSLICVTFPFWIVQLLMELLSRLGKFGSIIGTLFFIVFSVLFMGYIFPGQRIFWTVFIVFVLLYFLTIQRLKIWTYGLARRGENDKALVINRRLSRIPGYGSSLEGLILFNAGRYAEARAFSRPKAFDKQGNPLLTSIDFYIYALTLVDDGQEAEGEKLLREAVQAPQCKGSMKIALAACLLTQRKEPDYARKLMEEAMMGPQRPITAFGERADRARRIAQYGWALASCGNRQESEARIQEAFALADGLNGSDLAGVHYFAGEAWRAMGDPSKARSAFQETLRLSPNGCIAISARKAQARLDEDC